MNLKIAANSLRFKITEEELKTLLDGRCLDVKTIILDKILVVTISPQRQESFMEAQLVLDHKEAYLNLMLPLADVQKLSEIGRNRTGLRQQAGNLSITLKVDTRNDNRRVGK